ncbi:MAG: cytochrome c biogenesis CcdA family protein [Dehalococcoidia bacterium]
MDDNVTLAVAFSGGLVSFFSPCVLPMVPVYLASLYGPGIFDSEKRIRLQVFLHSLSFVIGFTIIYTLLGAIAGITGYAIIPDYNLLAKIAGGFLVFFGVIVLASTKVSWLNYEKHLSPKVGKRTGYLRSFLIGAAFSISWTACVGPILASILAIAATQNTAWEGAYLLVTYSLGLGLPFLIIGIAFDFFTPVLRKIQRYTVIVRIISGLLLILVGILILTGNLTWISSFAG